ncbi:MAG TPA: hypothetical protein PKM88_02365 [bacterium]|nr:hypothetical protein [bacterium]
MNHRGRDWRRKAVAVVTAALCANGLLFTTAWADTLPVVTAPAVMITGTDTIVAGVPADTAGLGTMLTSLADLNTCALQHDAVFVYVPGADTPAASDTIGSAVRAVQQTLKSYELLTGAYTLPVHAAGYAQIAGQISAPAVIVASKGKGMAVVSGEITAERLFQAFISTLRTSGCGSSGGCGASGAGCN